MAGKKAIGKVTHFYPKISVAVVKVKGKLKTGDTIEIETKEGPFQQKVGSMQIEHNKIDEAKTGDAIGLKVENPVKEGDKVSKIAE